jgi:hypothetical protein
MKFLCILLLIPALSIGQTVHIKDEKIVYEGKETVAGLSSAEIFSRIQKALPDIVKNYEIDSQSGNSITARGELKLRTPYTIIRTVSYSIVVNAMEDGYEYRIDSVSFTQKQRGGKAVTKSSEEVIEGISETGKVVGETEKILNETDMKFQRVLALLRSEINKDR